MGRASQRTQWVKNRSAVQETRVRSLGQEDPLEEGMAAHSSNLVWRVTWTEEPGGLQSIGSQSLTRLKPLSLCCEATFLFWLCGSAKLTGHKILVTFLEKIWYHSVVFWHSHRRLQPILFLFPYRFYFSVWMLLCLFLLTPFVSNKGLILTFVWNKSESSVSPHLSFVCLF